MHRQPLILALGFLSALCARPAFGLEAAEEEFFERRIRPILVERCYECHSTGAKKIKGELLLDSKAGWMAGGESGVSVVPGDPDASLLIRAVRYNDPDLEMPPKGRISDEEIRLLVEWVKRGAPDPRTEATPLAHREEIDIEAGRRFWAFRPIDRPVPPTLQDTAWPYNEIDRFIRARQEAVGVVPVRDAEDAELLRRLYFDLIGLPPTPAELNSFSTDMRPDRHARKVDELLASPRFGEKWGRHWLDLARYAESTGGGRSAILPDAWRYRNYVIEAFNADKPYDRFVREQVAGDLLPAADDAQRSSQLIATAFLALGPKNLDLQDKELLRMNTVDEQIDTVGRTVLGLTLGCARCHDHKFDPVPMKDYYALAGIFRGTRTLVRDNVSTLVHTPLPVPPERRQALREHEAALKSAQDLLKAAKAAADSDAENVRRLEARVKELQAAAPAPLPQAISVTDEAETGDYHICLRGNVHQPGETVSRGVLQVAAPAGDATLGIAPKESGRRELADWLASPENPLTARVYVNRLWHHVFGEGIVGSVDNVGLQGDRPSHPELLDYLAGRFIESGWSTKSLLRELFNSRTYRLASVPHPANRRIDSENRLRWRMPRRRLTAEELRDTMLLLSGELRLEQPDSLLPTAAQGDKALSKSRFDTGEVLEPPYRSVYVPVFREEGLNELFEVFDFANPSFTVGARTTSTLPTQALFLMNSPFVERQAALTAGRLLREHPDRAALLRSLHLAAVARPPTEAEEEVLAEIWAAGPSPDEAMARIVGAVFASVDFRYLR